MTSVASSPLSMTLQKSSWHSPVPYLFGDLAAMLGLIAFALLILACSYVKLSGYLEISEGSAERDLEAGAGNSSGVLKPAPVFGRLRQTKVLGRLAQNREAARKSRLREKAYVQQLETSRLKLLQLEQELERTRQQGAYISGGLDATHLGYSGAINSGIAVFVLEYGNWVEEQNRQICELRTAMNSHLADVELRILVHSGMNHYFDLFRMKATAAKADVFYLMSGIWKTSAEQFFLWIGGFRPSELLKVLLPHLDLLEQQVFDVYNLRQSCQQAEDALSQAMDKLQQNLSNAVAPGQLGGGSYISQIANAMEKLEALVSIVDQADHIRQETLQQMSRILTTRQAARGLLALGEHFQRLRALSSLWATRQPA